MQTSLTHSHRQPAASAGTSCSCLMLIHRPPCFPRTAILCPQFTKVAREWRCKYAMDADGTPAKSESLKQAQALLAEYLPKLKAIPAAEVTRVVCGGCGDFKVIINQPAGEHGTWAAAEFAPEAEFLEKLKAIVRTRKSNPRPNTIRAVARPHAGLAFRVGRRASAASRRRSSPWRSFERRAEERHSAPALNALAVRVHPTEKACCGHGLRDTRRI